MLFVPCFVCLLQPSVRFCANEQAHSQSTANDLPFEELYLHQLVRTLSAHYPSREIKIHPVQFCLHSAFQLRPIRRSTSLELKSRPFRDSLQHRYNFALKLPPLEPSRTLFQSSLIISAPFSPIAYTVA